ncbi:MAG: DUF1836 domain-containing protein [Acholeplasmatales bacterium]|nr:DUF1836 domain-containing protein [Acholeplasmatales bacterium]
MENINKSIENWLNELDNFSFKKYEELPDIDLYMDQLITYMEKQLYVFQTSTLDKQITPSMINNYVKGEVLKAPISKKYNREHLALIEEICTLKQVLTIAEVKQIEDERYKEGASNMDVFDGFNDYNNEMLDKAINDAKEKLANIEENNKDELINMAMKLALQANAYITIAKRVLFYTRVYEDLEKIKEAKEKAKKKDE